MSDLELGEDVVEDVGALLDELLSKDDGQLLAELARLRTNLMEAFGKAELTKLLCNAVDAAANVEFYTKRSRREVDPNKPILNLRVDSAKGLEAYPELGNMFPGVTQLSDLEVGNKDDVGEQALIVGLKAQIIHREICRPLIDRLNQELAAIWPKAKEKYKDQQKASMLLSTIFAVNISADVTTAAQKGRMCTLRFVI